ncbi:MAG TPA: Rnf-Nqr domain containing protein [Treponemataceae bacterium]|nr:Rnf-Nqr domain containing protein [Treponemataceae bacterium]
MKKSPVFVFIAGALSLLVPTTGRFAYGIVLVLALLFITFFTSLCRSLCHKLALDEFIVPVCLIFLSVCTVLFKQILMLFSPILAFTLDFSLYLASLSSLILGFVFSDYSNGTLAFLGSNMKHAFLFSLFALFFYFFRDYFGYGTFTLPAREGIIAYNLPSFHFFEHSFFWSSIPFALLFLSLLLAIFTLVNRKFDIIRRKYY